MSHIKVIVVIFNGCLCLPVLFWLCFVSSTKEVVDGDKMLPTQVKVTLTVTQVSVLECWCSMECLLQVERGFVKGYPVPCG